MMRVVIVGGSAQSTPHLFDVPICAPGEPTHVTLAARSKRNREAVARAIGLLSPGTELACTGLDGPDFERSLARADAVIVQIRVGGYAARAYDETFPLAFDMCGDEGLGPGGLAAAWRTWPVLAGLLTKLAVSGSRARVILLTSPIGILTRACLDAFGSLELVGICELPYVTLTEAAARGGAAVASVDFSYVGVNHLGWFTTIAARGRDLISTAAVPAWACESSFVPLKYLRLHYDRAALLEEQRRAVPRAQTLAALAERALETYVDGDRVAIERALAERGAPWYAGAVAPYLRALSGEPSDAIFFLTGRNCGYLPWLDAAEVIEIPHRYRAGSLEPERPVKVIPRGIKAVLDALVTYERVAAAAVRERDPAAIATALAVHPWLRDSPAATALADAIASPLANAFS